MCAVGGGEARDALGREATTEGDVTRDRGSCGEAARGNEENQLVSEASPLNLIVFRELYVHGPHKFKMHLHVT